MAVDTYYFDASDDAMTDADDAWLNEGYITNGTYTDYATGKSAGTKAANYCTAGGTGASGLDVVNWVRARLKAWPDPGKSVSVTIYNDGQTEDLGTMTRSTAGEGFSDWVTLTAPTGGWSWAVAAALEFRGYESAGGNYFYYVEIEVTHGLEIGGRQSQVIIC